jgi:type I restriction enzyme M protein
MNNAGNIAREILLITSKIGYIYKTREYGKVILPMTVLRRFDCVLNVDENICFSNSSEYNFGNLLREPENVKESFIHYVESFSANVLDVFDNFRFTEEIHKLAESNALALLIEEFAKIDLHPSVVSNYEMGCIFEEVKRSFLDSHHADQGEHYTPSEIVELMAELLTANYVDNEALTKAIYDPACGTGGILHAALKTFSLANPNLKLSIYGQEINDETFAICKSDTLIKGLDASNIKKGNSISNDHFLGCKFDYVCANPPFGVDWKIDQEYVMKEKSEQGLRGRFGLGMPATSDSQMLFLQIALSKMKNPPENTRVAIVLNGSSLFTGGAGSGPSEIRRHIIENDLLECIIGLPCEIFFNTGIPTYIWVLSSQKMDERKGKVQLINAADMFVRMRKALGDKRNEISKEQVRGIMNLYTNLEESDVSKVFDGQEFGYKEITFTLPQSDGSKEKATEHIGVNEDPLEYFNENILPENPGATLLLNKTKIGYEIPFSRHFFKYEQPKSSKKIAEEIEETSKELRELLIKYNLTFLMG